MKTNVSELYRGTTVHRTVYTDEQIYRLEMQRIFESVWVYVAHDSELPNAGDFKTTFLGDNPVIVSRGASGEVAVLYNRCRHRGLTVCQSASGSTKFFRCAYHGWTYDSEGALIGVPYPAGYADLDKETHGLGLVPRLETYRGFIFASVNPHVESLAAWLAGSAAYIDAFVDAAPDGKIEARLGGHQYIYDGNWKLQLEGSVDGYHPYVLHKSFFDMQGKHSGQRNTVWSDTSPSTFTASLGNGHTVIDQRGAMGDTYFHRVRMSPGGPQLLDELDARFGNEEAKRLVNTSAGNGFNLAIFPNLVLLGVQIRVIRPLGPAKTHVEARPTTMPAIPKQLNQMRLRTHEAFFGPAGFGAPDDIEAFNRTQKGLEAQHVEWLDISRGTARERVEDDRTVGEITDETTNRGIFAMWTRLMAAEVPA